MDDEDIIEEEANDIKDEVIIEETQAKKPKKKKIKKDDAIDIPKKVDKSLEKEGFFVTCMKAAGDKTKFEVELTKENIATFSSFKEKGTVIKLKGASVKYIAYLNKDQFARLEKVYSGL